MPTKQKPSSNEELLGRTRQRLALSWIAGAITLFEFLNFLIGPFGMPKGKTPSDFLFLIVLVFYALWAFRLRSKREQSHLRALFSTPETLLVVSLVLFLLAYLFASTANMSYAQRFALSNGNLRLAPDSTIQRLNAASQFAPLILFDLYVIVYARLSWRGSTVAALGSSDPARVWALFLTLASVLLYSLSFPSFASLTGFGPLAFVCLIPLIVVFYRARYLRSVFYGVTFGVLQTIISNFWLGTFSLVSLQFITIVFLIEYTLFMLIVLQLFARIRSLGFLIFPVAWVGFDYLRSLGFLGYSWGMLGTSQYQFLPLIQIAAVTGVWGVTFIVTLVNAVLAQLFAQRVLERLTALRRGGETPLRRLLHFAPLGASLVLLAAVLIGGGAAIRIESNRPVDHTIRVALIQQDTDPHKNDYVKTFDTLRTLTNEAMKQNPDLVVWSETAFVPNIERWRGMDPAQYPLAKLVDEFLHYQKSLDRWFVTGNDDYTESTDVYGDVIRKDYNASLLFSPQGERMQTYHKIHLVPFTEYFPYKKQLPWLYHFLTSYDVYLWEPGTHHVVFNTPELKFSTPICFEDSFPDDVRRFVANGAQAIVNLSNDYWSLSDVEGKQHYINSLFRAVENRRPLLRATASGLTAYVDPVGRLIAQVPYYRPTYLVANVTIHKEHESLYTRWGDWFPLLALAGFVALAAIAIAIARRESREVESVPQVTSDRRRPKRRRGR